MSILDNIIFSLNATMPIFLMMVVGYVLKRIGWLNEETTKALNKLVFRVFLPCLLFKDLMDQDFISIWDGSYVLYCFIVTIVSMMIADVIAVITHQGDERGEFIQASYRSAAATLGIAFMTNIYDNVAMLALMILGSVPLYNVVAVVLLTLTSPEKKEGMSKDLFKKTLLNILTNPIIIGIVLGLLWSVLRLPKPTIFVKSVTYLGNVASPLALIALGATFEFSDLKEKLKPIILVCFNKLFLFGLLFIPVAIYLGYRDEKLVATLIMLGSATTSSSFIMAKNMGHRGVISSCAVMTTTLLSSFTLAIWLFVLRCFQFI